MPIINVTVNNKIASYPRDGEAIVCNNTDYKVKFQFDSEWDKYEKKTALFIFNGEKRHEEFTGDTCPIPRIVNASSVEIGVYVDDIATTTGAVVKCKKSILCKEGKEYTEVGEFTVSENGTTELIPTAGFTFRKVTVTANVNAPIPEGYFKPVGGVEITENGTVDVAQFESAVVNVPIPEGYIKPAGETTVTENGPHDVTEFASVAVNVPPTPTQEKEITIDTNRTVIVTPDAGYNLSKVTVTVATPVVDAGDYSKFISGNLYTATIPTDVTSIGDNVFSGTKIRGVVMHNNITAIGRYAFSSCDNLKNVTVPASVIDINQYAFSSSGLEEATIQCVPIWCQYGAFQSCSKLTKVTFVGGGFGGQRMFSSCTKLAEIISPDGVGLNTEMFYQCSALPSVVIKDGTTVIPKQCFHYCSALENVTIPNSVTKIQERAFGYCTKFDIGAIGIPESVTTIENSAFQNSGAKEVVIPNTITSLGQQILGNCDSLTKVIYNNDLPIPINFASGCYALKTLEINGAITEIGSSAFQVCSGLLEATIPATVTTIGDYAFYQCNDTEFTILAKAPPTIGSRTFYTTTGGLVIYVPADSVDAYKSATNWSALAKYIQPISK